MEGDSIKSKLVHMEDAESQVLLASKTERMACTRLHSYDHTWTPTEVASTLLLVCHRPEVLLRHQSLALSRLHTSAITLLHLQRQCCCVAIVADMHDVEGMHMPYMMFMGRTYPCMMFMDVKLKKPSCYHVGCF